MKKLLVTSFIAAAAISFGQAGHPTGDLIAVQRADEQVGGAMRTLSYQSVISGLGSQVRRTLADGRIVVVRPPKGKTWQQHRRTLLDSGMFDSVEPDTLVTPCGTVNDPSFPNQWHLHEISVQRAWDFTLGGGKIVAVVDGGVDLTHPDLVANLVPGYNVLTSQTQQSGGVVSDVRTNGHGTRIAGVAAAVGNNGIGITGVGPDLRIMPIRVTDDAAQGIALRSDLLAGAQWAVQNGATAINVSYTGVENPDVEAMGVYARTQGAFLVWAAGNANTHWANFDHENVTVVGGLDQSGGRWTSGSQGSGYGRGVDIWAPCVQIYTTSKGGGYGNAPAGTSFAAPQVAATLALMKVRLPVESAEKLEHLVLRRASDVGSIGFDDTWGWGRINVGKAVANEPRRYRLETIQLPSPFTEARATAINDSGVVVGEALDSSVGVWRGFKWNKNVGFQILQVPWQGRDIAVNHINNVGQIAVSGSDASSVLSGIIQNSGIFTPYFVSGGFSHFSIDEINDLGVAVGSQFDYSTGQRQFVASRFWTAPSSPVNGFPGFTNSWHALTALNDIGFMAGQSISPFSGNVSGVWLTLAPSSTFYDPQTYYAGGAVVNRVRNSGFYCGTAWNEVGTTRAHRWRIKPSEIVGDSSYQYDAPRTAAADINEDGDTVGDLGESISEAYIHWGLETGLLEDLLSPPLPTSLHKLSTSTGINNRGDICGAAVPLSQIGTIPYVAWKYDNEAVAISLGQLGESPTYIGSIPPALSVTFVDEAGVPYPNSTVQLGYSGSTGRLELETPSNVTGPFRMFMRCSAAAIPGYQGPTFLSKMYPPLGEPAAPVDAGFLPFDGPLVGGTPTILMYAGDVDDSGEIDAADIDIVIANFGLVNGDDDWNYAVDVDGTGEIDAADIDLVIANFGLTGDPEP